MKRLTLNRIPPSEAYPLDDDEKPVAAYKCPHRGAGG